MLSTVNTSLRRLSCGCIVLAAVLGAATASAQVKSAYVKNVDEPGRLPYQVTMNFSTGVQCSAGDCILPIGHFPSTPIPQFKRLVLQHVSLLVPTLGAAPSLIVISSDNSFDPSSGIIEVIAPDFHAGPANSGGTTWVMDRPVHAYLEGQTASYIKFFGGGVVAGPGVVTVNGYLIDPTN